MKKLAAVLLTIGVLFTSVLAVNSFAAEPSAVNHAAAVATPSDPAPEIPEKLLASEWSDMISETKEFSADHVSISNGLKTKGVWYAKGSNVRMDMKIGSITVSALQIDDKIYYYLPKLPFFYISMYTTSDPLWAYNFPASRLVEAYYEDGYQVEKYSVGSHLFNNYQEYTYYFEGGELHSVEALDEAGGLHMKLTNFSYEVKDKDVMLPPTAIFNLTWFLG